MRLRTVIGSLMVVALAGTGVAFAADAVTSPLGQFGTYDKVALTADQVPLADNGVLIEGNLYVPIKVIVDRAKMGYYYDPQSFKASLFFGGAPQNSATTSERKASSVVDSKSYSQIEQEVKSSLSYDADHYHSGMMRQDILTIAALSKSLLTTTDTNETAVHLKLAQDATPNMSLLWQSFYYRSIPIEVMDDRMDALANELDDQVGRKSERKMEDVIDNLREAIRDKEKALNALEDWVRSSDEDDLDDYRDYEKDAKKNIYDTIKILTGEDLEKQKDTTTSSLLYDVDKWISEEKK